MPHQAECLKKFYLQLHPVPPNGKFKSKIFLSTPLYAAQQGVDLALCPIAAKQKELLHGFESIFKTVLAHRSGDQVVSFNEKNQGLKIALYCPFNGI
jgi:hypothetical protein